MKPKPLRLLETNHQPILIFLSYKIISGAPSIFPVETSTKPIQLYFIALSKKLLVIDLTEYTHTLAMGQF